MSKFVCCPVLLVQGVSAPHIQKVRGMTKSICISGLLNDAPEAQRYIAAGGEGASSVHLQLCMFCCQWLHAATLSNLGHRKSPLQTVLSTPASSLLHFCAGACFACWELG